MRTPLDIHDEARTAAPSLTWTIADAGDDSQFRAMVFEPLRQTLVELGHRFICPSTAAPVDVIKLVQFPLQPVSITDSNSKIILVGHDWAETGYPAEWIEAINSKLDGVACTSRHTQKILADHGIEIPLAIVGLGVDHWQHIAPALEYKVPGKRFRFLHISTCGIDEGVDLLIESYGRVFDSDDDVSLILKSSGARHEELRIRLEKFQAADPDFPHVIIVAEELDDSQLKALYGQCAVFLAPSRASGFNLPLALGLCSGMPAVTTAWGGHLDYCDESSCWLVDYNFQRSRSVRHLAISVWAEPTADRLDDSLWIAYQSTSRQRAEMASEGRKKLMAQFTWEEVASRLIRLACSIKPINAPIT